MEVDLGLKGSGHQNWGYRSNRHRKKQRMQIFEFMGIGKAFDS